MADVTQTEDRCELELEGAIDQLASTSKGGPNNTELVSYNTQDLKVLQYNSADDVRQSMKEIIGQKMDVCDSDTLPINSAKGGGKKITSNMKSKNYKAGRRQRKSTYGRSNPEEKVKKGGRPPKAGPSRRSKDKYLTIMKMYQGKLTNLVKFKSREPSDSDFESS